MGRRNGTKENAAVQRRWASGGDRCSSEEIKCSGPIKNGTNKQGLQTENDIHTPDERMLVTKDKCTPCHGDIFPHWLPWILFPLTLTLRILYIQQPTNWWILHPDEIFQTVEVAHSDAFGYGFRPYEYLPPPPETNSTIMSGAHAQKIQYGMFSLRSFLLPKILTCVLIVANWCGIKASSFFIVKVFHTIVTSCLPVVIFQFSQTLHHSRDTGCLSAILVSSSLSMNIFGTHTLINSFLAPLFFYCLTLLVKSADSIRNICESNQIEIQDISSDHISKGVELRLNNEISDNCSNKQTYQQDEISTPSTIILKSKEGVSSHDENANVIHILYTKENENVAELDNNRSSFKKTYVILQDHFSQAKGICKEKQTKELMLEMFAGIGLAFCIYIRFDLVLIPVILLSRFFKLVLTKMSFSILYSKYYVTGLFIGVFIGGYCDYVTYGQWFLAPFQWYKFNVRNNFAGTIFGINSFHFYILKLFQNEPLISLTLFFLLIHTSYTVICLFSFTKKHNDRANNQSVFTFIFLLLAYSLNSHKELRFLHNAVIFMYIAVSAAIISVVKSFSQNQNTRKYLNCGIYLYIALFTSSHCYSFVQMKNSDRAKWVYGNITDSHETNMCLDFIRQQTNVNGVFLDRSVYMSGAYSILQHDVPIFAFNIFEFMEYRRTGGDVHYYSTLRQKEKFSTFIDISDFISVYNSKYMYKKIRHATEYNFLILKTDNDFNTHGYTEVYNIGNSKVLARTLNQKRSTVDIDNKEEKIVLNATVLEHEGYWLKHYGVYSKAEQRLLVANRINPRRIGTFRVLLDMYNKLRQIDDYKSVLKACVQVYRKAECLRPYDPIVLHDSYYRTRT